MRRLLPTNSLAWWAVVVCALAAVAVFLAFEVLDLDGSDLAKGFLQPPISSQSTLAEAEGVMRNAAFGVPDLLGRLHAVVVLPQSSTLHWARPYTAPRLDSRRRTGTHLRATIRRAAWSSPLVSDEPPSPARQTL